MKCAVEQPHQKMADPKRRRKSCETDPGEPILIFMKE